MPTSSSSSSPFFSSAICRLWLSLVGAILLQAISGTNTTFPAYSSQLKHSLSLSQIQLNNLAFANDAGKLLGFLSGIVALHVPLWLVLLTGGVLGYVGYGFPFLFITDQLPAPAYWELFLLNVVAGNSICWLNTVCYAVCIKNFPNHQQIAVALTSSYQGLSAKLYTDVVEAAFSSSSHRRASGYLLLNCMLPLVVSLVAASVVKHLPMPTSVQSMPEFGLLFGLTVATGIYSVASSIGSIPPVPRLLGTVVLLLLPLLNPVVRKILRQPRNDQDNTGRVRETGEDNACVVNSREEIGVKVLVRRIEFWLYVFVYFLSATLGLVFLNNLGQIAESRGTRTTSIVSLASAFGFFGRLLPCVFDYVVSRYNYACSRIAFVVGLMAPLAGAFLLLLHPSSICLFISTAIIAVCTGAITSAAVSITTELFGSQNFSVNHNVVVTNISIGSLVFGYFAAVLYHKEGGADGKCMGVACYRATFLIWGCFAVLGTCLGLVLCAQTRDFYSSRQGRR